MNEKLTEMIDALITEKTFSLDAVKAIEALRTKAKELETSLQLKAAALEEAQKSHSNLLAAHTTAQADLKSWKDREGVLAVREKVMYELEKAKAVAEAVAQAVKECFGLVYRNLEVRSSMHGQAPAAANANPAFYPNPSVPINEDKTTTVG